MHFDRMRRREFVSLLGGTAAWPLTAGAQQVAKRPVIGFLGATTASAQMQWTAAFVQRLRELGWIEGGTVAIEFRWAEGQSARYAAVIAEFLRLKVHVIVIHPDPAVIAAKRATSVVPIVFPIATNPVENVVVASLSRPGGNATGLSLQRTDTTAKRVEILREIIPGLHRLGILVHRNPISLGEANEAQAAAQALGLDVARSEFQQSEDIVAAFDTFKSRVEALYVGISPLVFINRVRINTLAVAAHLPTMYSIREYVDAGGLISYGPNFADLFRRAAELVDNILRGAKPADIPVEQPTKFELVLNLTTAKVLDLKIPEAFLVRADEVIE